VFLEGVRVQGELCGDVFRSDHCSDELDFGRACAHANYLAGSVGCGGPGKAEYMPSKCRVFKELVCGIKISTGTYHVG
jgi:hypothetical protein